MADLRSTKNSVAARNAAAAAVTALADGGRVRLYSGLQPPGGGNPTGTLVWESDPLPTPAFNAPVNGVAALVAPQAAQVVASVAPTNFTVFSAADAPLWNGTVGEAGADQHNIDVNDDDFVSGAVFTLETLTYEGETQGN